MHITELDSFKLSDAVKFHNRLNPKIWGRDEHLLPEVREKLEAIAENFREFLGVSDLDVKDITVSGSNAAYNYTPYSDIDLHLVVAFPADNEIYQELFNAKKYQYNDEHNLAIGGVPVELYVQNADEPPVSQGEYSLARNEWIQVPRRKRARIDDTCVRAKVEDLDARIHSAIRSGNADSMGRLWDKIKAMRQSGLDEHGEFGCENIVFKILRNKGCIRDLRAARTAAQDRELSLKEQNRPQQRKVWGFADDIDESSLADMRAAFARSDTPAVRKEIYRSPEEYNKAVKAKQKLDYEELKKIQRIPPRPWTGGVSEGHQGQPYSSEDGVAATTCMFLNEDDTENLVQEFIQDTAKRLGIERMPEIQLHDDDAWSEDNHSFGMYVPEQHVLHVNLRNRHIMDILRTTAHELAHCRQHEIEQLDHTAGNTGSPAENEAHAVAGIIMRDFADAHPDLFGHEAIKESSGYIPTWAERNDPRFEMALSVDVHPGQTGHEANKMRLVTDAQGHPQLLRPDGRVSLSESLAREFKLFEEQDLFEINMGSKNLRREAARTGAIAGMEFEMIVPGIKSDDPEQEPDYESDQRCRSIDDAVQFFHDGDYNGRRDVERLRERMEQDYFEWLDEKILDDFGSDGEDYIIDWVTNNVDESEWNPDDLEGDDRREALIDFAINVHADPGSDYYNQAFDEYRDENRENWDESDWLDSQDLDLMSAIENAYNITWPYWTDMNSGEIDADEVADEFRQAVGKEVRVNTRYHQSGDRPGPNNQFYVVEPDGSLEGDNPGDEGLEFVSPPMPIDELLKDLNAVKAWAGRMGVYTNQSTGLHINISVPDYSLDRLDYVKLALLLGDEYVLKQFGRSSNTYTKSALGKVRDRVRSNPEDAQRLLDKMKGQMGELASKAIHSGITDKYTSINTKSGHIEFRSPGGDWLDDNFDKIENTLLRFTVAMSAALNPEAYKEEYQKKLYKLLTADQKDSDTIRYFSDYVAGKIPRAALRSFVKQAQLERSVKRGEAGNQPMWWSVSNPPHSHASIEVVASSKEEAIAKALGADGYPSWANTRQSVVAKPLRPYEEKPAKASGVTLNGRPSNPDGNYVISPENDRSAVAYRFRAADIDDAQIVARQWRQEHPDRVWIVQRDDNRTLGQPAQPAAQSNINQPSQTDYENRLGWPDQTGDANYEIIDRRTGRRQMVFVANTNQDAQRKYTQWLDVVMLPHDTEDYGYRAIVVPGSTIDLQRQRAAQAQQIPEVPLDIEVNYPQASSAPAGNSFSGQWKVLVNGQEVWRFRGVGNNQADANRIAAQWLRDNGMGVSGEGYEVLPVMVEGLAESASDYELHDRPKLDRVLAQCCRMVVKGQQRDPEKYGQVAACVIDPDNRMIYGINLPARDGTRRHAERVAIDKYRKSIGEIPEGSIIVTTCSPCNSPMEERSGESCKDLLNSVGIHKVYAGYQDPTQHDDRDADFRVYVTENDQLWGKCQLFAQTFLGSEELSEGFDQPYPLKWEKSEYGDIDALAKLPDGSPLSIMFNLADMSENDWGVEFYRNNSQSVTGEGDAQRVFATVLNAISQFIKKKKPDTLFFTAVKEEDPTGSRTKLYDRLVQRYATGLGYDLKKVEYPEQTGYQLTRKEQGVAENFADGRNPQDKGDSKRYGVPTKASVSTLRKVAKQGGRKGQLSHWMANMKAGRAKAKRNK